LKFFSFANGFQKFILNQQVVHTSVSKDGLKFLLIQKVKFFLAQVLLKKFYLKIQVI